MTPDGRMALRSRPGGAVKNREDANWERPAVGRRALTTDSATRYSWCTSTLMPRISISTEMATRIRPIRRSKAITTRSPTRR